MIKNIILYAITAFFGFIFCIGLSTEADALWVTFLPMGIGAAWLVPFFIINGWLMKAGGR